MPYYPHEAHLFKMSHLKSLARTVLAGKYSMRLATNYHLHEIKFVKN